MTFDDCTFGYNPYFKKRLLAELPFMSDEQLACCYLDYIEYLECDSTFLFEMQGRGLSFEDLEELLERQGVPFR